MPRFFIGISEGTNLKKIRRKPEKKKEFVLSAGGRCPPWF
jgi:hypothetical protein